MKAKLPWRMLRDATLFMATAAGWNALVLHLLVPASGELRDALGMGNAGLAILLWAVCFAPLLWQWKALHRCEAASRMARGAEGLRPVAFRGLPAIVFRLPSAAGTMAFGMGLVLGLAVLGTDGGAGVPFRERAGLVLLFWGTFQGAVLWLLGTWRGRLREVLRALPPPEVATVVRGAMAPSLAWRFASVTFFAGAAPGAMVLFQGGAGEGPWGVAGMFGAMVASAAVAGLGARRLLGNVAGDVEAIASMVRQVAGDADWGGSESHSEVVKGMRSPETKALASEAISLVRHYGELARSEADARRAAERTRRLKTHLMAFMGHDLRSPLNSIGGFAEILMQELDGPINVEQHASLSAIRESGEDLLRLITDMVDSARFEAGKLTLHRDRQGLFEVVAEAVESAQEFARGKAIDFKLLKAGAVDDVWIDGARLHQALTGVLFHVVRMVVDGSIQLRVSQDEAASFIEVFAATLPPEDTRRIFLAFREIRRPSGGRVGGLGLGLFLARSLAVAHGGELLYDKRGEAGARFLFRLPRASQEAPELG